VADLSEFERRVTKAKHPTGWEPSLTWNGTTGTVTAQLDAEPDESVWSELIADWGLDPTRTMVVDGSLQIRAWDTTRDGQIVRMKYYRCVIKPREHAVDRADIDALKKLVERRKPVAIKTSKVGEPCAFVIILSDWQLGKGEGGGSAATAERIMAAIDAARDQALRLIKQGRNITTVYLIGLGDLVESCDNFYAMQTWQADLTDREQDALARRLVLYAINAFVDVARIVAMGVPGNHGENRRAGKAFTDWRDNRDFATFETVADILSANPERYQNVSIPLDALNSDDLTMTLDIFGVPVAFAHGHQFRSGANSQAKMETWLKGQALGRTGVADAQLLFAGHLHHLVISESTGRTMIQVPAMDGGSKWFTSTSGASAPAGMLTMTVGAGLGPRGWDDLRVL
jgi:hypothetical protein